MPCGGCDGAGPATTGESDAATAAAPSRPAGGALVGGPRDVPRDVPGGAGLDALSADIGELRALLGREIRRRDGLVARVAELEARRGFPARVTARWRLRSARDELREVVDRLHRVQNRLLQLEARRRALAQSGADAEWDRLERALQRAAAAWEAGGSDPALADTALAAALEADLPGPPSVARYRRLVARLATVNERLAEGSPGDARAGEADDFLGLGDRGGGVLVGQDREDWVRLRRRLADEIVAVASEVTRRSRASS